MELLIIENGKLTKTIKGCNVYVVKMKYDNRLILTAPHEVLAYIVPNGGTWLYTAGHHTAYRRRKVQIFLERYAND